MMTFLPRQEFPSLREQNRQRMRPIPMSREILVGQGISSNRILPGGIEVWHALCFSNCEIQIEWEIIWTR